MTPQEFFQELKKLPPDTPITAAHIMAILEAMKSHELADLQMIDENKLAEVLDESVETIRYWRKTDAGPAFKKEKKSVRYRISDVKQYIEDRTVNNTRQGKVLNRSLVSVFMIYGKEQVPFFESIKIADEPDDWKVNHYESDFSVEISAVKS